MVPASNFCGVSPLGCKPSICDTSGVAGPSTCSVVGWWTWRFSGGWLVGLVDILPTGKDSKRRYGFLGGELKMRTFVVSRVFRCWEEMFEAHKVTIFWTLRIRKPLKTGCLQGPDPCYTGSNTSIAGYLGILREHWYFYQKNWTTHPSPPCKQVARSISLNMSWQATFAWKPRVVATSFRFGYSPTSTSSQKPGIPTNVIIKSVLFCTVPPQPLTQKFGTVLKVFWPHHSKSSGVALAPLFLENFHHQNTGKPSNHPIS